MNQLPRIRRFSVLSIPTVAVLVAVGLTACTPAARLNRAKQLQLTVGEIKEVAVAGRRPIVGTSDDQEVVAVSLKPLTPADSTVLKQGDISPTVFLVKGVTAGKVRVVFSEPVTPSGSSGRVRQVYAVQVVSN